MATPKKGPSLSGPLRSGWTAASLIPQATVAATAPPRIAAPVVPAPAADLSQYNLTQKELGTPPNLRRSAAPTTPLEQLLTQMFPDAAADFDPNFVDPMADPRNPGAPPSLFNTILGNLGTQPSAPATYTPPTFGAPVGIGNQVAATIPGAPAFLGGAINQVNAAGAYAPPAVGGAGALNIAGIAALAAEQRAQQNQLAQEQAAANDAFFQQQQAQQRAQRMTTQRQRQRFGGVNAATSGWASSPVLF